MLSWTGVGMTTRPAKSERAISEYVVRGCLMYFEL